MNSSISCSVCCCFHLQMEEAFARRFAGCNGVQLKSGTRFANFLDQQMNCLIFTPFFAEADKLKELRRSTLR